MSENMSQKQSVLFEELGIEADTDKDVSLEELQQLLKPNKMRRY